MLELTGYILERALDLACKELAHGDDNNANALKTRFIEEAETTERLRGLIPADPNTFAPSLTSDEQTRVPGSSPPGTTTHCTG